MDRNEKPKVLTADGKLGRIETIPLEKPLTLPMSESDPTITRTFEFDPWTFRVVFESPHGSFFEKLPTSRIFMPEHYLRPVHPKWGDKQVIEEKVEELGAANAHTMFERLANNHMNPEMPVMRAFVYRKHVNKSPWVWFRNPYFFAVDAEGKQLPYFDQILFSQKEKTQITSNAGGAVSFQTRHIDFNEYTQLMEERADKGYEVYHWYSATRGKWAIFPNLNRNVPEGDEEAANKHAMLNNKYFRRALSIAINREGIIKAEFNGQGEPAQLDPGPGSPFHSAELYKAWTHYDPEEANRILDEELGLTQRDREGMRTFPDGSRMSWNLNLCDYVSLGPAQFIVDDWAKVGIRLTIQNSNQTLFHVERKARNHDFTVWSGESEYFPTLEGRTFVPINPNCYWGSGFGTWYGLGGLHGDARATDPMRKGSIAPDPETEVGRVVLECMRLYDQLAKTPELEKKQEIMAKIMKHNAEQCFTINLATPPPTIIVVDSDLRNVPKMAVDAGATWTPANAGFETFWFDSEEKRGKTSPENQAIYETLERGMTTIETNWGGASSVGSGAEAEGAKDTGKLVSTIFRVVLLLVIVGGLGSVAVVHPFVARRLIWMIPTLAVISVIVFTVIQLPPGDYITNKIEELIMQGDEAAVAQMEGKKEFYQLEEPAVSRYLRWVGISWFFGKTETRKNDAGEDVENFSWPGEPGLLQGHLGYSMADETSVNEIVGDRIILTMCVSFGSLIFTYIIAFSTGIYSAVKQYSVGDYVLSFVAIIGMCVPNFLLALICIYVGEKYFGFQVRGLFSPDFEQAAWSMARVADLLKNIWVAVIVVGVGGTAGMMRIMRGNLLDEFKKPYVTTARAKGVRPVKLLMKYPVRLALNPFISGIGGLFPYLVSGSALVAMVLSLPTVGPLMLEALITQDMYLAGSMLMVLSTLGVIGTLVSDLLLLWLDPRIRMEGGSR